MVRFFANHRRRGGNIRQQVKMRLITKESHSRIITFSELAIYYKFLYTSPITSLSASTRSRGEDQLRLRLGLDSSGRH